MQQPRMPELEPVTLTVPSALRLVGEDERRALLFAAGRDPLSTSDALLAALSAAVLLLAFVAAALLR